MDLFTPTCKVSSAAALSFLLLSCSGSGGGAGSPDTTPNPQQLVKSLIRQSADTAEINDVWRCFNPEHEFSTFVFTDLNGTLAAYSFDETNTDAEINTAYTWRVSRRNTVELLNQNGELHEELNYIQFATPRALSMVSSTRERLNCTYHTTEEFLSIANGEIAAGWPLKDEPMLPVLPPDGFDQVMIYVEPARGQPPGSYLPNIYGETPSFVAMALFDNGMIPYNNGNVFNYGADPFVAEYRYELVGSQLMLGGRLENSALTGYPAIPLKPALVDERLDGCFLNESEYNLPNGVPGAPVYYGAVRWCFFPDGLFTIEGAATVNEIYDSPNYVPDTYNIGRYRLDGYGLRLLFDSGYQLVSDFGWSDKEEAEAYVFGIAFEVFVGPAKLRE